MKEHLENFEYDVADDDIENGDAAQVAALEFFDKWHGWQPSVPVMMAGAQMMRGDLLRGGRGRSKCGSAFRRDGCVFGGFLSRHENSYPCPAAGRMPE